MSCKPTYKGKRYNSLEELYKANGANQTSTSVKVISEEYGVVTAETSPTETTTKQFVNLIQPQIQKQAYQENVTGNKMFMYGLRWTRKNKATKPLNNKSYANRGLPITDALAKDGYVYDTVDQNGNSLPSLSDLQPIINEIEKELGIDMSDYDAVIGNIYLPGQRIQTHRDTTESLSARNYPVIVYTIGAGNAINIYESVKNPGLASFASDKKTSIPTKNGTIYTFGKDGKGRFELGHDTPHAIKKGDTQVPITMPDGTVVKDYTITLTFRRAADLEPGMPTKPSKITTTQSSNNVKESVSEVDKILDSFPTKEEIGYQKLQISDIFTADEINDLVFGYLYYLTQSLEQGDNIKLNKNKAIASVLKMVQKSGNKHLSDIILEEGFFNDVKELADDVLAKFGVTKSKEFNDSIEEEDSDGNLDIMESYERDPSSFANDELNLFLTLIPKFKTNFRKGVEYDKSPLTGIPRFENANIIKNTLYGFLSNKITDSNSQDGFEVFINELEKYESVNPTIKFVLKKIKEKSSEFHTNFYQVFNNSDLELFSVLLEKVENSYVVTTQSSSIQNRESILFNKWVSEHLVLLTKYAYNELDKTNEYVYDTEKIKSINDLYVKIEEKRVKKELSKEELESLKKNILDYLNNIGISITENQYTQMINHFYDLKPLDVGRNTLTNEQVHLKGIKNLFNLKEGLSFIGQSFLNVKNNTLNTNEKTGEQQSIIENQKFTKYLANVVTKVENDETTPIILGAEGKKYWNKIKYNILTKSIAKWKSNKELLETYLEKSIWAKNSLIGKAILDGKDISVKIFNNFKKTKSNDEGSKVTKLKLTELLTAHFNMTLQNKFVGLAEADKSMQFVIDGFETIKAYGVTFNGEAFEVSNDSNMVDLMLDYLKDEINRIIQTYDELYDSKNQPITPENKIEYLHTQKNGLNSYLFPSLTTPYKTTTEEGNVVETNLLKEFDLADYFLKPFAITKDFKNNISLREHISQSLSTAMNEDLELFSKNFLVEVKEGKITSRFSPPKSITKDYIDFNQMFATFVFNSMVGTIEMSKLFLGDPAAFKQKEGNLFSDITKRIPLISATGLLPRIYTDKSLNLEIKPTYNSATTNESEGPSRFYFKKVGDKHVVDEEILDNMLDAANTILPQERKIKKAIFKKSLESYKDNNKADAQSWITLDLWKQRWASFKGWNSKMEESYQRLKNKEATFEDISLVLQPLKTVTTQVKVDENGQTYAIYHKMSEAVIPDFLFKDFRIQHILKTMQDNNVDQLVTIDANKVGAVNVNEFFDNGGQPIEGTKLNFVTIDTVNTTLQLDMPLKGVKNTLIGSQLTKNALAAVIKNATYKSPITGNEITGEDLILEYHKTIATLSDEGLKEVSDSLGIDFETRELKDTNKLFEFIADALQEDLTSEQINTILKYKNIDILPGLSIKIQNVINKKIKKSSVALKQKGGSGILMSGTGLIALNANITSNQIKNDIIWFKKDLTKGLSPTTVSKEGKVYKTNKAQILIGHKELRKNLPAEYKNMTSEQLMKFISPEILQGLMYRIPNQSLASNDAFEIVGILPDYMGDTIIAFDEITTKTGSDFDIDKAYYILPNFELNEDGVLALPKTPNEMSNADSYEEKFKKDWSKTKKAREIKKEIENTEEIINIKTTLLKSLSEFKEDIQILKEQKEEINEKLKSGDVTINELKMISDSILKQDKSIISKELKESFEEIKKLKQKLLELDNKVQNELKSKLLEEGAIPTIEEFSKLDFYGKATKAVLENKRLEFLNYFLSDPRHVARVVNPIDSNLLKNMINDLHGKESSNSNENLNFWKGTTQLQNKLMFDMAKSMVGIIANAVSDHNISIQDILAFTNTFFGKGVTNATGNLVSAITSKDGVEVSQTLNDFMNAIVDAAKDPFIVKGNVNLFTANTVFMLIRTGVELDFVMSFIGQPILKELSNLKSSMEGRVAESLYEDGIFIKPEDLLKKNLILSLTETQKETYDKLKIENKFNLDNFNTSDLTEMIKKHNTTGNFNNLNQLVVLETFLNLLNHSKTANDSVKATKEDVEGPGKDFLRSSIKEYTLKKFLDSGLITGVENKLGLEVIDNNLVEKKDRKMFGAYYSNGTKVINNMSSIISLSNNESFKSLLDLVTLIQKPDIVKNEDLLQELQKEFISYALSNENNVLNVKNKLNLFQGENSVARMLVKFTNENKELSLNNPLLRALIPKLSTKSRPIDIIQFNKNNAYKDEQLIKAWEELDELNPKLARMLAIYSFNVNSFNNNYNTFHEFIPPYYTDAMNLMSAITTAKDNIDSLSPENLYDLLSQIVVNNPDSKIVRKLPKNNKNLVFTQALSSIDISNTTPGDLVFYVNDRNDFLKTFSIGNNVLGENVYPHFVSKEVNKKTAVYRFIGLINKNPVYANIRNLGLSGQGYNIREYNSNNRLKSSQFSNMNTPINILSGSKVFITNFGKTKSSVSNFSLNYNSSDVSVAKQQMSDETINEMLKNCSI